MSETKPMPPPSPELGYDRHDARAGPVFFFASAIIGVLFLLIIGVWVLYVVSADRIERTVVGEPPSDELKALHEREEEQLNHYGYIDKEKGIVRLPIDRSIELLLSDVRQGKVPYNTKTYAVKPDQPDAAAAGAAPAGAPGAPGTAPAPAAPAQGASANAPAAKK
jgi:hypothetical protein